MCVYECVLMFVKAGQCLKLTTGIMTTIKSITFYLTFFLSSNAHFCIPSCMSVYCAVFYGCAFTCTIVKATPMLWLSYKLKYKTVTPEGHCSHQLQKTKKYVFKADLKLENQ